MESNASRWKVDEKSMKMWYWRSGARCWRLFYVVPEADGAGKHGPQRGWGFPREPQPGEPGPRGGVGEGKSKYLRYLEAKSKYSRYLEAKELGISTL